MNKVVENHREEIITKYMHHILEVGTQPLNIFKFTKENEMQESDFYAHFSSFDELEKEIFSEFFKQTIGLLEKNEEYLSFDAQNKLLSFYFTFFEILTKNRSYVLQAIKNDKFKGLGVTKNLRSHFKTFIESIDIETIDIPEKRINSFKEKGIVEAYWGQFAFIIRYWEKDNSPNFEKTDVLIEKLVTTAFDLQDIKPLESVIDLGKFLLKDLKK
ncbi:TetR/AcrR family transcriptional regulator [Brumimicrobium aurantiacum]|nr:TetR/AcrR family transcriptional regulator [Brumimicrobium aurantiacum]